MDQAGRTEVITSHSLEQTQKEPTKDKPQRKCQNKFCRYISGFLTPNQLIAHSIIGYICIWSIFGASYGTFNQVNHYSIMSSTFSYLGSNDKDCNPNGWYWFSIGMFASFFVEIPLIMYIYQRLKLVNYRLAKVSNGFWLVGVCAQFFIGVFPSSKDKIFGNTEFRQFHNPIAVICFVCVLVGAPCSAALVAYDKPKSCTNYGKRNLLNHRLTDICIALIMISICLVVIFCVLWQIVYPIQYKKDPSIGSNWSAGMNTIWSFALWENVCIITLYVYILWFPFTLDLRTDEKRPKQRTSCSFSSVNIEGIVLKTELSVMWFKIIKDKRALFRSGADFLEHLADYEEVEGLLSQEAVEFIKSVGKMINEGDYENAQKRIKQFGERSNELWQWKRVMLKCAK
ncbi:Conserved_hypothetical protein [Hexamita inflata]|uniref:Uncharacterized protein n=1 Tax=Hexamita inflata TaxID=28002 RepID=A0AA86RRP9_9EUKA|nr:Conserved hypothetical protein [Hexamita inflata]